MNTQHLRSFYALSVALTGFTETELLGTGVGDEYYDELVRCAGYTNVRDLLERSDGLLGDDPQAPEVERAVREELWRDERFGPMVRNIVKMWFVGNWAPGREEWPLWLQKYGDSVPSPAASSRPHVVSARAYKEGLVWHALGTHAPAANPPGFGSWSLPPVTGNNK